MTTSEVYRVALVGCGAIGSRHLQALVRAPTSCEVHVCEPSETAKATALKCALDAGADLSRLIFHDAVEGLPDEIELGVITTASGDRRAAFDKLLSCTRPAKLIFEKFLFSREVDFDHVSREIARNNIAAWVNCPRRIWPGYLWLRDSLVASDRVLLRITGGEWGLASNAIHAFDTFTFLTGRTIDTISTTDLEPKYADSKRTGYVELFGTLRASTGAKDSIELVCYRESGLNRLTEYVAPGARFLIKEKAQEVYVQSSEMGEVWERHRFGTLNVSEMGPAYADLLETGACGLPTYSESACLHVGVLRGLADHLGIDLSAGEECRIT